MKTTKTKQTTTAKAHREGRAMSKRQFPAHLQSTPEEWRGLKRTEWREVAQAFQRFLHGSAYAPAGPAVHRVGLLIQQVTEAIEPEDWIAW